MQPHVLIVDDDSLVRTALSATIQRQGYESIQACDGEDALLQFKRSPTPLIFTDIRMPRMDGLTLLRQLTAIDPPPRVVLITAYGEIGTAIEAMKAGAYDFLIKPFSKQQIETILEKTLGAEVTQPMVSPASTIVSRDPKMLNLLNTLKRVANDSASILLQGESGTGKEIIACQAHLWSNRRKAPFVAINCAAIPESLLESELFGYEKGAFTGANTRRVGKFEAADGGTLLLDEISEMPAILQAKLLRALQERMIDRIGGSRPVKINIRVIATTNRDLRDEMRQGRFRQDLYYRLAVVPLILPPLRERKADIPLLAQHFLTRYAGAADSPIRDISPAAITRLTEWSWPGNVRELESCLHRSVLLCDRTRLEAEDLKLDTVETTDKPTNASDTHQPRVPAVSSLYTTEKHLILDTLAKVGSQREAAELLGVSVRTIRNKLRDYREQGQILPLIDRVQRASMAPNGDNPAELEA